MHGCTPQNVYRHLRNHHAELDGHVIKGPGRQGTLLDQEACEFIRSMMCSKKRFGGKDLPDVIWSDDVCIGYAVYAMESVGLETEMIRKVIQVFPEVLTERTHCEAEQYGLKSQL